WLAGERRAAEVGVASVDVPYGEALASTREDRALSAERWLEVALRAPRSFRRAVDWCGERREAPLPNCRNVAVADRVCEAVGSLEFARWSDG
ncbi:MAG TPA: hypothetical protein VKU40_16420, partial [Thermoanaerobaculia bacterium]|nr:hypothetical protein [Thermoanaerobaculia bacterium]